MISKPTCIVFCLSCLFYFCKFGFNYITIFTFLIGWLAGRYDWLLPYVVRFPVLGQGFPVLVHGFPVKGQGFPVKGQGFPVLVHGFPVKGQGFPVKG